MEHKSLLESSYLVVALACHPFTYGSYFRQREIFLAAFTAPTTLGFKGNQNELSALAILTGLDMKAMALRKHATEKQSTS